MIKGGGVLAKDVSAQGILAVVIGANCKIRLDKLYIVTT